MDALTELAYARGVQELAKWRDVSLAEFEVLRTYPRPLEARPPLTQRKVNFRAWLDDRAAFSLSFAACLPK
jgi:hypothetical protein